MFADAGGELRYYVRFDGQEFTLSHAQRAEGESLLLAASDVKDVERMLSERIGADLRAHRGEAPVPLPFALAELAPGYRLDIPETGWADLIDERVDRRVGRFRHTDVPFAAVSFSWYAGEDPSTIRAAFEGAVAEFGGAEAEGPGHARG